MVTYAIVFIAVLTVLFLGYRSLSVRSLPDEKLLVWIDTLIPLIHQQGEILKENVTGESDQYVNVARASRKIITTYQQQLDRLTVDHEQYAGLFKALEALFWAARLMEQETYQFHEGMHKAASELLQYSQDSLRSFT
jgi:hypothetical protein